MKKNYFLLAMLMLFVSVIASQAQTYSLNGLTADQFVSGGNDQWSFERHDVNAGTYSTFTMYGDSSTAVNFYDPYITERFNLYPIMNRPASGTQYEVKRNAWFSNKAEFAYIAAEYPNVTTVGENLTYANYPDSLKGYEVYSNSLTSVNAAVSFTVPSDGYYRADMKVIRMDLWSSIGDMKVYQFFRYSGQGSAYPMGQEFSYGKTQGIDSWAAGNEAIYNADFLKIPESPSVNSNNGKPFRGLPTKYTPNQYFYFYAKAGDKISFETDARSTGNGESTPRGAYARTKWTNLVVTTTDQATATAVSGKFVNPYANNPALLDSLNHYLDVASDIINNHPEYSQASLDALAAIYTNIDNKLSANAISSMEIPSLIEQLQKAIAVCRASQGGLKARYTFDNVTNGVVPDLSGQGNNGTLVNNASIVTLGKYKVMDLGSSNGYLDMGANVGSVISSMSSYTISAYYRVDPTVTLSGNGLFLWTFSTVFPGGASSGQYIYYQLQNQRLALASAGWNSEKAVTLASAANKGAWQQVVYTQDGADGKLYINGSLVNENTAMPIPSATFTTPTINNWIGRPGFNDPYLKNTLVYDVRLYNYAVKVDSITKWNGVVADLETATNTSTNGDYTVLDSLATAYSTLLGTYTIGVTAGTYPQAAKDSFNVAIATAQALSAAHTSSQLKINAAVLSLKSAYQTFLASIISEVNTLAEGKYYITLTDSLYLTNPGATLAPNGSALTKANGGLSTTKVTSDSTQVWNISKVTSIDPFRFSVFSALNEEGVYRHLTETPVIQVNWGTPGGGTTSGDDNWRSVNIVYNGTAYAIQNAGNSANKGYWQYDLLNKKLISGASLPAYQFNFSSISTGINDIVKSGVRIFAANNSIRVTTETPAIVNVYTITGELITKINISGTKSINVRSGMYIVKVTGNTTVVGKVIVK